MSVESPLDKRCYDRPPFPSTWCRMHGRGRVFYTSMGHREDVWTNPLFQQILLGGLQWSLGDTKTAIPPNIDRVAPEAEKTSR
jgi:type 1 glutamine amidotransferase